MSKGKIIFKRSIKVLIYLLLSLAVILLSLWLFINSDYGKSFIRNQAQQYLQNKINSKVSIGKLDYDLPNGITLEQIYIEDKNKDTLLYASKIDVKIKMMDLLDGEVNMSKFSVSDVYANLYSSKQSADFNYQFIIDAFASNDKPGTTKNIQDTSSLKLNIKNVALNKIRINYKDVYGGTQLIAAVSKSNINFNKIDLDKSVYDVKDIVGDGISINMQLNKGNVVQSLPADIESLLPVITVHYADLKNSNIKFNDTENEMYFSNQLHQLQTNYFYVDLNKQLIKNKSILIDSADIIFNYKSDENNIDTTTSSLPWIFNTANISVKRSHLIYNDIGAPVIEGFDPSHVVAKNINTDVSDIYFGEDSLSFIIKQLALNEKSGLSLDTTHVNFSMNKNTISAKDLYVKTPNSLIQRSFEYIFNDIDDIINKPENSHFNLSLYKSYVSAKDLSILNPELQKILPNEFFTSDKINLTAEANGNLNKINLTDFEFSGLNGSRLKANATLYNLLDSNKIAYDINIINTNLLKKDIAMFIPKEQQASLTDLPDNFQLSGKIKGDMKNADASIIANAKGFEYNGNIVVNNFDKPEHLKIKVNTKSFSLNTKLILNYLPKELKDQLYIPANIAAKGSLQGNSNNFNTDLSVSSSLGLLKIKGFVTNIDQPEKTTYDLILSTPGFMLGKLLKQDSTLGNINGSFVAKGNGIDYKKMSADFGVNLNEFEYNRYKYKNIDLGASLQNGMINSLGKINDQHLQVHYNMDVDVKKEFPIVHSVITIDTIQLHELHLIEDTLNLSGNIDINAANLEPHHLDASVKLSGCNISTATKQFPIYDASIIANTAADGADSIHINTSFATVDAGGIFDYNNLSEALFNQANKYYQFKENDTSIIFPNQHFGFIGNITADEIINSFIPDEIKFNKLNLKGNIESKEDGADISMNINTQQLSYTDKEIRNINFDINGNSDTLKTKLVFDSLKLSDYYIHSAELDANLHNNKLDIGLLVKDNKNIDWLGLNGQLVADHDNYSFQLTNDLLLNYEYWNTIDDNEIRFGADGILVNNFMLSNDTSLIYINSTGTHENSRLAIDIDNFSLKSIGSLLSDDTNFISGVIDAKMSAGDFDKAIPSFTGTAEIEGLAFMNYPIGNIFCEANKVNDDEIKAKLTLNENGNDLQLDADYFIEDDSKLYEAKLHINQFNLKTIEAFSEGQLQHCKGNIHGDIIINSIDDKPNWNGNLFLDSTAFKLAMLGTTYRIHNQQINFVSPDIIFNDISIVDSLQHQLNLKGKMMLLPDNNLGLDIGINGKDFVLMNAKKTIGSEFYGYAVSDLKVLVSGTMDKPNIEGDVVIGDKTDVTLTLPNDGYVKDDGNTVVRFVDRDTFLFSNNSQGFIENKKAEIDFTTFLKYNLNLSVSKNAVFKIIIDPSTGDEIKVQGDAHINAGVDPGGNIQLTGNYELDKGYYTLNYELLKRQFNLIKGSNLNFAGDVEDAVIDITAAYISNASSYDLVSNEVTNMSNSDAYKQKIPYQVMLHITGKLFKPEINFDIQLPEQGLKISNEVKNLIESKLNRLRQDQATLNKQVFSLLLMNKFISEQSADLIKYSGTDFSSMAKKSVSGFLTSAINDIAGDIFKGIDVDLNLNSYNDYTKGNNEQKTDLNIAISKSFFNNRLTISVGNKFGLSGQQAGVSNNIFRPDVNMAYKLSKDGKYMISAYTKNQFEIVLDGYVVESGVSFSITLDYDTFNEFFGNKNKN
jgi:hypothetical protein